MIQEQCSFMRIRGRVRPASRPAPRRQTNPVYLLLVMTYALLARVIVVYHILVVAAGVSTFIFIIDETVYDANGTGMLRHPRPQAPDAMYVEQQSMCTAVWLSAKCARRQLQRVQL